MTQNLSAHQLLMEPDGAKKNKRNEAEARAYPWRWLGLFEEHRELIVNILGPILSPPTLHILGLSSFTLGPITWSVGILEPAVAAYAFRLYRNLGVRVGAWLITSFCLLALGHFLQLWGASANVFASGSSFDLVAAMVPLLLLIGMAHIESTYVDRIRVERKERQLRLESEGQAQVKITTLLQENKTLGEWLARCEEREKALEESAQQLDFLFTQNPQAMWVFDQCSLRVLAVNNAALKHYGFTLNEFLAKTARELLPDARDVDFLTSAESPIDRPYQCHHRKDGSSFDVQLRVTEIKWATGPARLVLAENVVQDKLRALNF